MKCWNRKRKPKHHTKSKYHKRGPLVSWNSCRYTKEKIQFFYKRALQPKVLNSNFSKLRKRAKND